MNEVPDHPVYNKSVLELITVANDYCVSLAQAEKISRQKLTDYLLKVLPLLYLKTSLLPEVKARNPEFNEKFWTEEEWEALFNILRNKFGKADEFWFVNQAANANETIKGSLAEHLTDIFQALKDFLMLYQKNSIDARENAVEDIIDSFQSHWGYRLVDAHKTLHYMQMDGFEAIHEPNQEALF